MTNENMKVLVNTIGAVESGGQVYGKQRYDAYAPPYNSTPKEVTITLGWAQNYGNEGRRLIQMIHDKDLSTFRKLDTAGIEGMLSKDWVKLKWNPTTAQKNVLIKLIDSPAGHEAQDELFAELMETFIADCERQFTKDVKAVMMYCEIRHLGGKAPADRIFKRCNGDYSLDNIMASLKKDQSDTSSNNQVGDRKFWSRHVKCREFIDKYAKEERMTIVELFSKYIGVKEYNGIVATIQKWYYGSLVKDAWCATSTSYFANQAGILSQLGGKHEGVYEMMKATKALHQKDGRYFEYPNIPKKLYKNDIVFFQRNGTSHVAHCWQDCTYTGTGNINVLGGNQSDMICKKDYAQNKISAIYRPDYGTLVIKKGDSGNEVKDIQTKLEKLGYKCGGADGVFGAQTEAGVKLFQSYTGLKATGQVDVNTRNLINKMYSGMSTKSKITFTVKQLTNAIKDVHTMAKNGKYKYGNSLVLPPCADKLISCDRLEARALYNLGMTDQRKGGETCGSFPTWFDDHGFKKITNMKSLKEGDMVIQGSPTTGRPCHMYYVVSYKNGIVTRYDTGSNELIMSAQPVQSEVLWKGRTFYGAYRIPDAVPSGNDLVKKGQAWLNMYYGTTLEKYLGAKLTEDGDYGTKTRSACVCVWKDVANRKYKAKLSPANPNFLDACKETAKKIQMKKGSDGTYPMLIQIILASKGYYKGAMDAYFGDALDKAVRAFQKAKKLTVDGLVGPETWYALFN